MPEFDQERREMAESFQARYANPRVLSSVQARLLVRCLQTTWEVEKIAWSAQNSSSQRRDAERLLHAADILEETVGPNATATRLAYQRAAELLEWLSRSTEPLGDKVPLGLLSASAYQLAGLPAMAAGLLKLIDFEADGSRLFAAFLRGDMNAVLVESTAFWQENDELTRPDSSSLLGDGEDGTSWHYTVEVVRALGLFAYSLRAGHAERVDRALLKLKHLSQLGQRVLSADLSLLMLMVYQVAKRFSEASVYTPFAALAGDSPANIKRMRRLARRYYNRGRGTLWASQRLGLSRLVESSAFALCTPTGSGKTLVANLAIVKELILSTNGDGLPSLALYLVPSRALAGEVEGKLSAEMRDDVIVTGLYGGNDWGITDYWLQAEKPAVIIATVEKAEALLRNLGPLISARLRLLVLDEAHQIVPGSEEDAQDNFARHSERSLKLESFVSRILASKPDIARIALTAVAGGAAGPVARWIESDPQADPIGLDYRSTRQIIGQLETVPDQSSRLRLDLVNGAPIVVSGRGSSPYINLQFDRMPQLPSSMRNSLDRFNQLSVLWTALHLTTSEQRILISIAQQPERTMGWFVDALALKDWDGVNDFVIPETGPDADSFSRVMDACIDYCGAESHEVSLLKAGIASSHGQMPQRIRRLMNVVIERGICPVTVATATLTEGVNLPFDVIFVPLLTRSIYDPLKNRRKVRPMTTSEFRNLSGRAGRPGSSLGAEGMTFIAVPQAVSTTAEGTRKIQETQQRNFAAGYRDLIAQLVSEEVTETALSPLSLLLQSLFEKANTTLGLATEEAFLDWLDTVSPGDVSEGAGQEQEDGPAILADTLDELDGVLLAAIEEVRDLTEGEREGADLESALAQIWSRTFSAYAKNQEDWLERAFVQRGQAIVETVYPDAAERKRLYLYGLTPHIGRRFEEAAVSILEKLKTGTNYATATPQERLAFFVDVGDLLLADRGFGFSVRDSKTDSDILADWHGLLAWWFAIDDAPTPPPAKLRAWQRFVNDNLEFRLGTSIGAVVAKAWNDGAGDVLKVPSLEEWKETTGLPWVAFWARELLRWGTHDPFIAFCLSQGLARTRDDAAAQRNEFQTWLAAEQAGEDVGPEQLIDPQYFLAWKASRPITDTSKKNALVESATLTGTDGHKERYDVLPIVRDGMVEWIDPAGYVLAETLVPKKTSGPVNTRSDYDLVIQGDASIVRRVYRSGR